MNAILDDHLKTGLTTICRCWKIVRRDGQVYGFTDHDRDLSFDGTLFEAGSGLNPTVLAQSTGLAADNSEAVGALDASSLTEADIAAGLYDDAEVTAYLVNWADTSAFKVLFRGRVGEITRAGGVFRAEIRGLSEQLGQSKGRIFLKSCSAVLGDAVCGVDLNSPGYRVAAEVTKLPGGASITVAASGNYEEGWFDRGLVRLASGAEFTIKRDVVAGTQREITFWQKPHRDIGIGEKVELIVGCDRRAKTCQLKFSNMANFQGFPDLPNGDFVMQSPSNGSIHDGGSRR